MNRLMIGSGIFRREGWATLDGNPEHGPDFLATIPPLPAEVRAVLWDEIEWIHGITSLCPWDGLGILREIRSVLSLAGRLTLEQPDFSKCSGREEWVFGDPGLKDAAHMNRWGFTPETLSELLRKSGFGRIDILPAIHHVPARDFRIEAYA